jgi:hypothetical protein
MYDYELPDGDIFTSNNLISLDVDMDMNLLMNIDDGCLDFSIPPGNPFSTRAVGNYTYQLVASVNDNIFNNGLSFTTYGACMNRALIDAISSHQDNMRLIIMLDYDVIYNKSISIAGKN